MTLQIAPATLAVMRQFDDAGIFEAYIQTSTGDYRAHFENEFGNVRWYLDVTYLVNAGDVA